jgi:hypothetical protein
LLWSVGCSRHSFEVDHTSTLQALTRIVDNAAGNGLLSYTRQLLGARMTDKAAERHMVSWAGKVRLVHKTEKKAFPLRSVFGACHFHPASGRTSEP